MGSSKPRRKGWQGVGGDRDQCCDLVRKMLTGGEQFTRSDKHVYEWLMKNMAFIFSGTIFGKLVPAFKMALKNAWEGGEKIFFDMELLRKLDIALDVSLITQPYHYQACGFDPGFFSKKPAAASFAVDKS